MANDVKLAKPDERIAGSAEGAAADTSPFGPGELRKVLGDFATGVTVLACEDEALPLGMTANAFTSVSLDPPLVLVSVAAKTRLARRLKRDAPFSISFLAGHQEEVARHYGTSRNQSADQHWKRIDGLPVVAEAAAHLGCRVAARHRHGTHFLVVAEVAWIARDAGRPVLTFHRGQFDTRA